MGDRVSRQWSQAQLTSWKLSCWQLDFQFLVSTELKTMSLIEAYLLEILWVFGGIGIAVDTVRNMNPLKSHCDWFGSY